MVIFERPDMIRAKFFKGAKILTNIYGIFKGPMGCLMDVPHQSRLVDLLIGRIEIVFPSNWTSSLPFKYPQTSLTSTFLLSFHVCTYKSVSQLLCNHLRKNSGKFSQPQVPFLKMVKSTFLPLNISSFYARCKCSSTKSVLFPKVHAHKKKFKIKIF